MSTTDAPSPADRGSGSNDLLGELVACPLCGADKGYSLRTGSTHRWWRVSCSSCGDDLGECRADGMMRLNLPPLRHPYADTHWQRVGAHAQRLRKALQEADNIMGHEDPETAWRERWQSLWPWGEPNVRVDLETTR
jgi:hypothetical protein